MGKAKFYSADFKQHANNVSFPDSYICCKKDLKSNEKFFLWEGKG